MKIAVFLLLTFFFEFSATADERGESLKAALKGADKLQFTIPDLDEKPDLPRFTFAKPAEIEKLIQSLAFEEESPGYCSLLGPPRITFFKGDQRLASLFYYDYGGIGWGSNLWEGDSVFTPESHKAWRTWFKEHGEPWFQQTFDARLDYEERQTANREAFLNALPGPARKVIESYRPALDQHLNEHPLEDIIDNFDDGPVLVETRKKLISSIPDRQELTCALVKSLGTLSLRAPDCGCWSSYDFEINLVLKTAEQLTAADFDKALTSSDPAILLGVARLFFFGQLSQKFPAERGSRTAAKLIDAVANHDRGGNATWIFQWLDRFSSPEMTQTLEQIALGELELPASPLNLSQNLSFPHYACLLLSKTDSQKFEVCLEAASKLDTEYPDDPLALLISRANRDSTISVPGNIFESRSTPICLDALSLLEKQRTKEALDLIITEATAHDWADVRENAVLTIERMTGKKWFQNGENERAEWHGENIRKWWTANKSNFKIPKSKPE
ncbi:MAG: hypothetical protein P1U90_09405 [Akkermansiaceae bacterium]|nr:hypothetical protein [Akkermansiaceae bacterium]